MIFKFLLKYSKLILLAIFFLFFFYNCKHDKLNEPDDPVELKMLLFSNAVPDAALIWEEVSKLAKKDISATVSVEYIPWKKKTRTKISLIMASRNDFDLIFTGAWTNFYDFAKKGYYYPLNKLLPEYAPLTWKNIPKIGWEQASYNGNIFAVPFNSFEIRSTGLMYRKDLAEKYKLKQGKIRNMEELEIYLEKAREDLNIYPMNIHGLNKLQDFIRSKITENKYPLKQLKGRLYIYLDKPDVLVSLIESQGFKNWITTAKRWADKRFWSKELLLHSASSRFDREAFIAGKSAVTFVNLLEASSIFNNLKRENPEHEFDWYNIYHNTKYYMRNSYIQNAVAVSKYSKNPEKALMLLEKLHQDSQYFDLTTFGIRGKHWDLDAKGQLVLPPGVTSENNGYPWDTACPWGWREEKFYRMSPLKSKSIWEVTRKYYKDRALQQSYQIFNPYLDFLFDVTPVSHEWNKIQSLDDYFDLLIAGFVDDPQKAYEEYIEKMKLAGFDKFKNEMYRQWLNYLNKKGG